MGSQKTQPADGEKQQIQLLQQVTTLSISHAQNRARSSLAMARKGTMKWNLHASRILQSCCKVNNKIQGFARTLRQEKSAGNVSKAKVVHSCFPCSKPWLAWTSKRQCPREALFIVVKVVQVVFLSCPGEALYQLLSICPGEALLVSPRSVLTILHTTPGGCARTEAEMCIIVKTTSF